MDANGDDFITIFEYRAYVEDGTMLEQFEHLWQAYEVLFFSVLAFLNQHYDTILVPVTN